jgi:hypothetical protein
VAGDPVRQGLVHGCRELPDDAGGHLAVVGHVVVGHDGQTAGPRGAAGEQTRHQPARSGGDRARHRVGAQGGEVGGDIRRGRVEIPRRGPAIARLGHRQRDHGEGGTGEVAAQGGQVGGRVHGAQTRDDLRPGAVRAADQQRVERVLGGESHRGGR